MTKKTVYVIGLVLAGIFLLLGIVSAPPSASIDYYGGYKTYVGGDAYNYIIEATFRAGKIAGAVASRAVYLSAAGLLLFASLLGLVKENAAQRDDPGGAEKNPPAAPAAQSVPTPAEAAPVGRGFQSLAPQQEPAEPAPAEAPAPAARTAPAVPEGSPVPVTVHDSVIVCPICGARQQPRRACYKCKTLFDVRDENSPDDSDAELDARDYSRWRGGKAQMKRATEAAQNAIPVQDAGEDQDKK